MAVTFDAAASANTGTSQSSLTYAHACSGADRVLVVAVAADSTVDATGVTYGGVAMTKGASLINQGGLTTSLWYLANPATGSNNVIVTFAGAHYFGSVSMSFTGCDTASVIDGFNTAFAGGGSTTNATVSVTTSNSNSMLAAAVFHNGNSSRTANGGSTIRGDTYLATDNFATLGLSAPTTTPGANSIGETMGLMDGFRIVAFGINEGAGSTATPRRTLMGVGA